METMRLILKKFGNKNSFPSVYTCAAWVGQHITFLSLS